MAKKQPPGFVPIPFRKAGRVMLPISLILIVLGGVGILAGWGVALPVVLFVGFGLLVLSLYLRYAARDE